MSAHTLAMNATILSEVICAALVMLETSRLMFESLFVRDNM